MLIFSVCNDLYKIYWVSEKGSEKPGQKGIFSFLVPATTSEINVKATFDNNLTGLKIKDGVNEVCNGNICKFSYKSTEPLKKGQKLELQDRMSLGSDGSRMLTALEVNEEKLCEGLSTNKKGDYLHGFKGHLIFT